jgi:hypothetical protein
MITFTVSSSSLLWELQYLNIEKRKRREKKGKKKRRILLSVKGKKRNKIKR